MRVRLKAISALLALTAVATAALFVACESDVLPTAVPTATVAIEPTGTRVPVSTYTATPEPVVVLQPTPTATPSPAATDTATPEPLPTETSTPEQVATETPTPEPVSTDPATAEPSPTGTSTPTPTETPIPTPTMIPTPTEDEIAIERVGEFLPWYVRSTRPFEFEAGDAVLHLWMQNNELGETLARLSWVNDGVTHYEAPLVKFLSDVGVSDPELGARILGFPWVREYLSGPTERALESLSIIFERDPALLHWVSSYRWISDDLDEAEEDGLYFLKQILVIDFELGVEALSVDWVVDGITVDEAVRLIRVFEMADSDVASAMMALAEPPIEMPPREDDPKGVGDAVEAEDLEVDEDPKVEEEGISELTAFLSGFEWATGDSGDGRSERQMIRILEEIFSVDAEVAMKLVGYPWFADGIEQSEIHVVGIFRDIVEADAELARQVSDTPWFASEVTESVVATLEILSRYSRYGHEQGNWAWGLLVSDGGPTLANVAKLVSLRDLAAESLAVAQTVADYIWVSDGIDHDEAYRVEIRAIDALESIVEIDERLARTVAGYPWVSDGIARYEATRLESLHMSLGPIHPVDREISYALVGYAWFSDGLTEQEAIGVNALSQILSHDRGFGEMITGLDWFRDGLADAEGRALWELWTMKSMDTGFADRSLALISEGVENDDWLLFRHLQDLAHHDAEFAGELFEGLRPHPRRFTVGVLGFLTRLAFDEPELLDRIVTQTWFEDGLGLEDVLLLTAARGKAYENRAFFEELMNSPVVYRSEARLDLLGDTSIWVISNRELANHDELGSALRVAAQHAESFMNAPFPNKDIIAVVAQDYGSSAAFFEETNIFLPGSHVDPDVNARVVMHEVGHYYFSGEMGEPWLQEGGAEFLVSHRAVLDGATDYETRLEETRERTRENCNEISRVYTIQELTEFQDSWKRSGGRLRVNCNYNFGEYFLLGLVDIMGLSAVSESLKELYELSRESSDRPSEQQLYEILLSIAPASVQSDVSDHYRRLHGGLFLAELDHPEGSDAVPDVVIDAVREFLPWADAPENAYQAHALLSLSDLWQLDSALAESVVQNAWLSGQLNRVEMAAIGDFARLAAADLELARTLGEYEWFRDRNMLFWEQKAIRALQRLAERNAEYGRRVINIPWVTDGLNNPERTILEDLSEVARNDPEVFELLMEFGWVQDDLDFDERFALVALGQIALVNAGIVDDLSALRWLNDGVSDFERTGHVDVVALETLARLVRVDGALGDGVVELRWFEDGVTQDESFALQGLLNIAKIDIGRARGVLRIGWFIDGVNDETIGRLNNITNSLR